MRKLEKPICTDCERLWREYQRAHNEYLHLLRELRVPDDTGSREAAQRIERVSAAEFGTRKAKQALDAHADEMGHH